MDGRFVPNLPFGAGMIEALRKLTDKPLDVHLMVAEPERYIEPFAAAGASVFTFHPKATTHVPRHPAAARGRGRLAGPPPHPRPPPGPRPGGSAGPGPLTRKAGKPGVRREDHA